MTNIIDDIESDFEKELYEDFEEDNKRRKLLEKEEKIRSWETKRKL